MSVPATLVNTGTVSAALSVPLWSAQAEIVTEAKTPTIAFARWLQALWLRTGSGPGVNATTIQQDIGTIVNNTTLVSSGSMDGVFADLPVALPSFPAESLFVQPPQALSPFSTDSLFSESLGSSGAGGSVTKVAFSSTDLAVSGSPITTAGTIVANLGTSGVVAGAYSAANVVVDGKGRVTSASNGSGGAGRGLFTGNISVPPTQASSGFTNHVNFAGSTVISDQTDGVLLRDPTNAATEDWRIADKAIPAAPFTASALLLVSPLGASSTNAMLMLRDSVGGKLLTLGLSYRIPWNVALMQYNSPTSFNGFQTALYPNPLAVGGTFAWVQIKDDGTNLSYSLSGDGVDWEVYYTVTYASSWFGARPNRLGIGVDPNGAGVAMTLLSYLETSP